jgi:predicted RNA-binding Zn ribbon-like protein
MVAIIDKRRLKSCEVCNTNFKDKTRDIRKKYCSVKCRSVAGNRRFREKHYVKPKYSRKNENGKIRREAKEKGEIFWFPINPCQNGHLSKRRTSNAQCVECEKINNQKEYKKEINRKSVRKYQKTEKGRQRSLAFANSEKGKLNRLKYRASEKGKATLEKRVKSKEFKIAANAYTRERRKRDPVFKVAHAMRVAIKDFLKSKGIKKTQRTQEMIGCTPEFLKKYLEKQFYPHPITKKQMTWDNHTSKGWHIDHRIPLAKATTPELRKKIFHYTNLQPMWWEYNLAKRDKYEGEL